MSSSSTIVVLGCTLQAFRRSTNSEREEMTLERCGTALRGAGGRRALAAVDAFRRLEAEHPPVSVVCSGGRAWDGVVEADALFEVLVSHGVPEARIARERCSHSTRDNARFTAAILRRRNVSEIHLVTCDWHMPRAQALFARAGIHSSPIAVRGPERGFFRNVYRAAREHVAGRLDGVRV